MTHGLFTRVSLRRRYWTPLLLFLSVVPLPTSSFSQTSSTGALTGVTLDPSGAALPLVSIQLTKPDGTEARKAESDENGRFGFSLLPPGTYAVRLSKADFGPVTQ